MSRILWLSNPEWVGSGYGEQTALFRPRLAALGHDVAVQCNFGLMGTVQQWNGVTVYPSDGAWGNKTVGTWAEDHKADAIIALCDAWVMHPDEWPDDLRMAIWAPIDHFPVPPAVLATLAHPKVTPIAMSRFGEQQMRDCELDPIYVPHGVDTTLFRPRPEVRNQVRDGLGIPRDVFLVGMVAANKGNPSVPRKGFPQAFHAFSNFAKTHKDAWMYAHTEAEPSSGGGIHLAKLASIVGIPDDRLMFTGKKAWARGGPTRQNVADLYQAFDVLLAPSMGEGFGIPILEAQACGIPVITSDHSAMREVGQVGWLVTGDPWWDALQDSFFIVPSIDSITAALEAAYTSRGDEALSEAAATFAQTYDANLVTVEYWEPALERLIQRPESRQVRRARERRIAKKAKVAA